MFQGNWVDLIVLFVLAYYVWRGFEQGVFLIISEMIAWIGGFSLGRVIALWLAPALLHYFGIPLVYAEILLLLLVIGIITQAIYLVLAHLSLKVPKQFFPWWWQGFLGAIPSLVTGVVIVVVFTLLVLSAGILRLNRDIQASWYFKNVYTRISALEVL